MDTDEQFKSLRGVIYGLYGAITSVLPSEDAAFINDVLLSYQGDPETLPTERLVYSVLTDIYRQQAEAHPAPRPRLVVNNA